MMLTGELIKYYRKRRGMTQDELAARLGTSKQTVSKYEKGVIANMKRSTVIQIAQILDVDAAVLFGLDLNEITQAEIIRDAIRQRPILGELLDIAKDMPDDDIKAMMQILRR